VQLGSLGASSDGDEDTFMATTAAWQGVVRVQLDYMSSSGGVDERWMELLFHE